jgi:hypothetical protein
VYTGTGNDTTTGIEVPDNLQSSKIVVRNVKLHYTLWMDNYYNSPSLCSLLTDNGINVPSAHCLNRKHVPQFIKSKKLEKTEFVCC